MRVTEAKREKAKLEARARGGDPFAIADLAARAEVDVLQELTEQGPRDAVLMPAALGDEQLQAALKALPAEQRSYIRRQAQVLAASCRGMGQQGALQVLAALGVFFDREATPGVHREASEVLAGKANGRCPHCGESRTGG